MICANPECNAEFEPEQVAQKFCHVRCRNRMKTIRETERKRQQRAANRQNNPTHPCKRCGGPARYKQVYCDDCKATPKGTGIAPLRTPRITAARQREQEAIDRVVAKALASGAQGPQDVLKFRRRTNYRAVKVG